VTDEQVQAPGRVSGKYVVLGLGAFGVVFLGFMILLAKKLDPAADRFHNPPRAAPTK
jgi:hypothetical protein